MSPFDQDLLQAFGACRKRIGLLDLLCARRDEAAWSQRADISVCMPRPFGGGATMITGVPR